MHVEIEVGSGLTIEMRYFDIQESKDDAETRRVAFTIDDLRNTRSE